MTLKFVNLNYREDANKIYGHVSQAAASLEFVSIEFNLTEVGNDLICNDAHLSIHAFLYLYIMLHTLKFF